MTTITASPFLKCHPERSLSGTLYIGITSNLLQAVFQYRFHQIEGFTDRYKVEPLLYRESSDDVHKAIAREKQLKGWRRSKKIVLIEAVNPHWLDLAHDGYPGMKDCGASRGPSTSQNDSLLESFCCVQDDKAEGFAKK